MRSSPAAGGARVEIDAYLVPGIAVSYHGSVRYLRNDPLFAARCAEAGIEAFAEQCAELDGDDDRFYLDTVENQKLSYLANCCICDQCLQKGMVPRLIVGHSMGLYAALYAAGYYDFGTGLKIVETAYHLVKAYCGSIPEKYAIGVVLGLTEDEVRSLVIDSRNDDIMFAMYNGKRNFVLAGLGESMEIALRRATREGAIRARRILTDHPYHTPVLEAIREEFQDYLNNLDYTQPRSHVISLVDGRIVEHGAVPEAVIRAIHSPLHLDRVVDALGTEHGVSRCVDIGPDQAMKKMVRYISKSLRVQGFTKVLK